MRERRLTRRTSDDSSGTGGEGFLAGGGGGEGFLGGGEGEGERPPFVPSRGGGGERPLRASDELRRLRSGGERLRDGEETEEKEEREREDGEEGEESEGERERRPAIASPAGDVAGAGRRVGRSV